MTYTIYRRPDDYPHGYVVRAWDCSSSPPTPLRAIFCASLDEARRRVPDEAVCLGRMPSDDPCIVESWL